MGPAWRLYNPASFQTSLGILDGFLGGFVEKALLQTDEEFTHKEESGETIYFVDSLSQYTKDKRNLRDQLVNILLAGRDTTAACLSWLFYELAYHPKIYEELRKEVSNTVGEGKPTYEDLKNMKYLQYCLNEGTSLYSLSVLIKSFEFTPLCLLICARR
jgi:Cytochrome P450